MNISQSFRLAVKSLLLSKMRSILTMLGIIIGVAAVIIITSLGNGVQTYMNDQFEEMGSNIIRVQLMGRGGPGGADSRQVSSQDMLDLVDKYPNYISGATPYVQSALQVRAGGEDFDRTAVYGVSESFRTAKGTLMTGERLGQGRFLQYVDVARHQSVCVVGSRLSDVAFGGNALGKTVSVNGVPCTIVGVLEQNGDGSAGSGDDAVYLPYTTVLQLQGGFTPNFYMFTAADRSTAALAKGVIERKLQSVYHTSDAYFVLTSAEMMDAMDTMLNLVVTILTLIAAISLLVGGIGIMNIMLVSVTERTREIGIRKSLGAKGRAIRSQFIIEAATTSAIGGAIGIVLGLIMANVLTYVMGALVGTGSQDFSAVPTAGGILLSFGVSVAIGVVFGYLPANKAAKLNPIDALRYE